MKRNETQFAVIDHMDMLWPDVLYPFALEELLMERMRPGEGPLVHLWRDPNAMIVGLRDRRLPQAEAALAELAARGVRAAVRHSGGAAVPLDAGVLNVALLLPSGGGSNGAGAGLVGHRADFEAMASLIAAAVGLASGAAVDAGEVAGSYCPGDFDLGVGGRKFCGLAQRRKMNASAVQAFIVVAGAGEERAARARDFYRRAAADAAPEAYPHVAEGAMGSLAELAGIASVRDFADALLRVLGARGSVRLAHDRTDPEQVLAVCRELRRRYDRS